VTNENARLLGVGLVIAMGFAAAAVWRSRRAPEPLAVTSSQAGALPPPAEPPLYPVSPPGQASGASLPPPPAAPPGDGSLPDEATLMMRLREIASSHPDKAIVLAEDGNRRYPDSADAPERTSILIHALAAEGRASEARGTAEMMVNHFEDSHWVQDIEAFTGAHRHRNLRLGPDGRLQYY